jgi:hypothetical protein
MSMLRKIKAGWRHREWLKSSKRSILVNIVFIFVPSQAGVKANERANRLDGNNIHTIHTLYDGGAMDHADVLHALREAGRVKDSLGDGDSSTKE